MFFLLCTVMKICPQPSLLPVHLLCRFVFFFPPVWGIYICLSKHAQYLCSLESHCITVILKWPFLGWLKTEETDHKWVGMEKTILFFFLIKSPTYFLSHYLDYSTFSWGDKLCINIISRFWQTLLWFLFL